MWVILSATSAACTAATLSPPPTIEVAARGLGEQFARELDLVCLHERAADFAALRLEECIGHAAANEHGVNFIEQVADDADLVADFGAAQDGDEGALRRADDAAQI